MMTNFLCCTNGLDVLGFMLSSERVFMDFLDYMPDKLNKFVGYSHFASGISLPQIVLRTWDDELVDGIEFRLFVSNGKPTALTQYFI